MRDWHRIYNLFGLGMEHFNSKSAVNKAGEILLLDDSTEHEQAKAILDRWRALHVAPLNKFQASLRRNLKKVESDALVSQRLKRAPSIVSKLKKNPTMSLARMQDIGGIRAVVKNMHSLRMLEQIYKKGTPSFSIVRGGKDYVNYPKPSGYRSVHRVFKCKDGYSIELQIRTKIQHSWATAVETMGTFLRHSLKSSEGPEEWLTFFALAGSAFAILESTPRVPGYDSLSDQETFEKMLEAQKKLDVVAKLTGFRVVARHIKNDKKEGLYHLITLDLDKRMARIQSFDLKNIDRANELYSEAEKEIRNGKNSQVVLVSSESIGALKKAYPSFFLDSEYFAKNVLAVAKRLEKIKSRRRGA